MDDIKILEAVERYIRGEMNPDERLLFENLRKTSPDVDQLVVEHTLFLQQMNRFGEWKKFRGTVHDVHTELSEQGKINSAKLKGKAKVVYLWKRYKRVAAIAASIAGVTTIGISMLVNTLTPTPKDSKVQELVNENKEIKNELRTVKQQISDASKQNRPVINTPVRFNGTGFLIDGKGLMITNAHVVKNSKNIYVQNNKGEQFKAKVLKLDLSRDVAIITIDDDNFKAFSSLPYGIRKNTTDLAEPVFTLGYPRNEIVYGQGYLSAATGFNGDTLSCQISVDANPGNSGGPVFNRNGEVIGIVSQKQRETEGAVFAVQSKYIFNVIEELKSDSLYKNVKLSSRSQLAGMDRTQQVKRIEDYVFMVKGD